MSFDNENFVEMFKHGVSGLDSFQGKTLKGYVVGVDKDYAVIDVGLKSEGRVALSQFKNNQGDLEEVEVGQEVDIYVERYEDVNGVIVLSRDKARKEALWRDLYDTYLRKEHVEGTVLRRVKGGFIVNIRELQAFLPGSQLDIRTIKDINSLVGTVQKLEIIKMDSEKYSIVVSRKAVIEKENPLLAEPYKEFEEGQVLEGIVKNITGYGVFVSLGVIDGLVHITDISWTKISHPSEVVNVGDAIKVKVIKIDQQTKRLSLGIKQLEEDPWLKVANNNPVGSVVKVAVTNVTDYGAFVEIEDGVEGLIHLSEMSWSRRSAAPSSFLTQGQELEATVIEVDPKKRRINLSLKRNTDNPWDAFAKANKINDILNVEVVKVTGNLLIVRFEGYEGVEAIIRSHNIGWDKFGAEALEDYKQGDKVEACIINIDADNQAIELSIKHCTENEFLALVAAYKKGDKVTGTVKEVKEDGVIVEVTDSIEGFIKKYDAGSEEVKVGDTIEAEFVKISDKRRQVVLSIKALEASHAKEAMQDKAVKSTLGDVFGKILKR